MRTLWDRVRYVVLYEVVGLVTIISLSSLFALTSASQMGWIAVAGSALATLWNFIYNYIFDAVITRIWGTCSKSQRTRVVHTLMFQGGLLLVTAPATMLITGSTFCEGLSLAAGMTSFYIVYNYLFSWGYDLIYPLPDSSPKALSL